MQINTGTGLLDECVQCPSPNKDIRPDKTPVELVVIHSISLPPGEYGGDYIEAFFQNKLDKNVHPYFEEIHTMQVSAHVLIKRNGTIIQFVPFHERAWHAGESNFQGRKCCNDFSIGIELEGTDTDSFEDVQYQKLATLTAELQQRYPEIINNITGHSDIAPERKKDPGTGFDWNKFNRILSNSASEGPT